MSDGLIEQGDHYLPWVISKQHYDTLNFASKLSVHLCRTCASMRRQHRQPEAHTVEAVGLGRLAGGTPAYGPKASIREDIRMTGQHTLSCCMRTSTPPSVPDDGRDER